MCIRMAPAAATIAILVCLLSPGGSPAQSPGADSVVSFVPGTAAGWGADSLPQIVLGNPNGLGELEGSLDVVSLGDGGEITLSFEDNVIVNGPGPDFTVFENPFFIFGDSLNRYIETALVEVSSDGVEYTRFPFDILPEVQPAGNPHRYTGFAGVDPVMSSGGTPDPTDPQVSGGDQFDLEILGIPNIRFVRLTDTGDNTYDDDGDLVTDTGLHLPPQAGFDLDAICHINWTSRYSPFRVTSAVAVSPSVVRVTFSKTLDDAGVIPAAYFTLDGKELTEDDTVVRNSDREVELHLAVPLPNGGSSPILSVSQYVKSATGENLLDTFGGEVALPTSTEDEPGEGRHQDSPSRDSGPLPSFPNPFNGSTTIGFEMSEEGHARVSVYDLRGKLVRVLMDDRFGSGTHRVVWDGAGESGEICPSGMYLINLELGGRSYRMKIVHQR